MHTYRTRTATRTLVTVFCFLATVTACESRTNPAGGSARSPAASAPSGSALSGRLTTATLRDASLNDMAATRVMVPSGWRVQGQESKNACNNLPSASWDAISPDGQSQFHVLPTMAWRWGNGGRGGSGCIPLTGPLRAADFIERFAARIRGLRIEGPMPVSEAFRRREEKYTAAMDANNAHLLGPLRARNLGDVAAVRAMDSSGHELRLRAWVQCQQGSVLGGNCFAKVDVAQAPKGRLNALVSLADSHKLYQDHPTHEWMAAFMNRQRQVGNREMAMLRHQAAGENQMLRIQAQNSNAALNASHQRFMQQQATQQRNHEAFLSQMQSSTQSSMHNENAQMNAQSTAASDTVDYALDQQTVRGANGTYKTSSQYSNVWSSPNAASPSHRSTFGSTENTANPNSATNNTWTKDTKVHGNGQPW